MTQENQQEVRAPGSYSRRQASIYHVLLDGLEPPDRQWVIDIVARQREAEREGDVSGEAHPRALW